MKIDQLRYDPTFLTNYKEIAKEAYGDKAQDTVQLFLFPKLPIQLQNEQAIARKNNASIKTKTFVLRQRQYAQLLSKQLLQPFNQAVPALNRNINLVPRKRATMKPTKEFDGN